MTTTTNTKKTSAEIKVLAVNTLYEWAEVFYKAEKEHFSKFIGIDIFKVDGSIKQKYDHEKQSFKGQLPDGTWVNAHYWFTNRYNSFDIHIKVCVNGGSYDVKPTTAFCQYEEMTLTLFNTKDGKLEPSNEDISHLSTRFNVEDLKAIAANIEKAAKAYEAAADKMPYRFKEVFHIERLAR
jgi:hypothetical protein